MALRKQHAEDDDRGEGSGSDDHESATRSRPGSRRVAFPGGRRGGTRQPQAARAEMAAGAARAATEPEGGTAGCPGESPCPAPAAVGIGAPHVRQNGSSPEMVRPQLVQ